MYSYKAFVRSVYDADTIRVDIDLGFSIWRSNISLRLFGIDAPEIRGEERPEGLEARDVLREKLPEGKEIRVDTRRDATGKYGRYLATIYADGVNLNEWLVQNGYAKVYGV